MQTLVLLRHGESEWNRENRFTGWRDVPLSQRGVEEALESGRRLRAAGFLFDRAYTSLLKRAIKTLWLALEELDQMWIPVVRDWRLNERHYGALTGLDKAETAALHGEEQVKLWRRSYDLPPPAYGADAPENPARDRRYAGLEPAEVPLAESLKDTVARFLPYWSGKIVPSLEAGELVLIVAHGNSLRALIQHLEGMSREEVLELNVPTGIPLVYELDERLKVKGKRYLADEQELARAQHKVAAQGRARA